jgi:hypothetical protein
MQRLNSAVETSYESSQSLHADRRSFITPITATTLVAMTTALFMVRPGSERPSSDYSAQQTVASADTGVYPAVHTVRENVHSGPFHIEDFPHAVSFLDDGFTIAFNGQSLRLRQLKALWSQLTLADIQEKLGDQGISQIECAEGLCMYSGDKRNLHIDKEHLVRMLQTMNDDTGMAVTVSGIPYKLTMENGFSTLLIPRSGKAELIFDRQLPPPVSIASTGNR